MRYMQVLFISLFLLVRAGAAELAPSAAHLQQAERVVLALDMVKMATEPANQYLAELKISNPERYPAMAHAFAVAMNPESISKEFSAFFASQISEESCKALADFWESPTGKDFLKIIDLPDTEKLDIAPEKLRVMAEFAKSPEFAEYSRMVLALDEFLQAYTLRVQLKLFVNFSAF